jgi:hypothetical protein
MLCGVLLGVPRSAACSIEGSGSLAKWVEHQTCTPMLTLRFDEEHLRRDSLAHGGMANEPVGIPQRDRGASHSSRKLGCLSDASGDSVERVVARICASPSSNDALCS